MLSLLAEEDSTVARPAERQCAIGGLIVQYNA